MISYRCNDHTIHNNNGCNKIKASENESLGNAIDTELIQAKGALLFGNSLFLMVNCSFI